MLNRRKGVGYALVIFLWAGQAVAQEVVDNSAANITADQLAALTTAFSEAALDPMAVQLRNIRPWQAPGTDYVTICGDWNGKNKFGGYVGFAPFQYFTPYKRLAFNSSLCP